MCTSGGGGGRRRSELKTGRLAESNLKRQSCVREAGPDDGYSQPYALSTLVLMVCSMAAFSPAVKVNQDVSA